MAATFFNAGDNLTNVFMNTLYSGGGHVHDSTDADGHAQKIDLTRDTTGTLPIDRVGLTQASFDLHFLTSNGVFTADQTIAAQYVKLTGDTSSIVWLTVPSFSGTSTGTAVNSVAGDIPADIRPPVNSVFSSPVYATNGSAQAMAMAEITTAGQLKEWLVTVDGSNQYDPIHPNLNVWSASYTKGNNAFTMTYPV